MSTQTQLGAFSNLHFTLGKFRRYQAANFLNGKIIPSFADITNFSI